MKALSLLLISSFVAIPCYSQNWPQAAGPNATWRSEGPAPTLSWSAVRNENIRWRTTLPEGGQSAVTVWGDRAFVTTHREMEEGSDLLESNLVGYCLDANSGEILWKVDLPGTDPVQTAGIFSDATVFAPIADGEHVWFFNRCGSMGCFDLSGKQVWLRSFKPRPRHTNRECEPVLVGNHILTVEVRNKEAGQAMKRHKPVPDGINPRDVWTYLHAIDKKTGKVAWVGETGTAVHNTPMVGQLADGRWAIAHARGGGHGPLEKPYGVSLSLLENGKTLWNSEIAGDSVFNTHWNSKHVFWFQKMDHLVLDTMTGEIVKRQNVSKAVSFTQFDPASKSWQTEHDVTVKPGKKFPNTNQTNILAGDWHYFLAHDFYAIGRVNVNTGKTEYLQLPAQLIASKSDRESGQLIWEKKNVIPNDTKNSRGISIARDKRAKGTGFGHVSAASPVLINQHLFVPIMNGTVYVIDTTAEILDKEALVAINDLGTAGETWTLASFSYANGALFMHTMKEVICIGSPRQAE